MNACTLLLINDTNPFGYALSIIYAVKNWRLCELHNIFTANRSKLIQKFSCPSWTAAGMASFMKHNISVVHFARYALILFITVFNSIMMISFSDSIVLKSLSFLKFCKAAWSIFPKHICNGLSSSRDFSFKSHYLGGNKHKIDVFMNCKNPFFCVISSHILSLQVFEVGQRERWKLLGFFLFMYKLFSSVGIIKSESWKLLGFFKDYFFSIRNQAILLQIYSLENLLSHFCHIFKHFPTCHNMFLHKFGLWSYLCHDFYHFFTHIIIYGFI